MSNKTKNPLEGLQGKEVWSHMVDFVGRDNLSVTDFSKEENTNLAMVALLVHAAVSDRNFVQVEYEAMNKLLKDRFHFDCDLTEDVIKHANNTHNELMDVDEFISTLNRNLSMEERESFLAMIWHVVLADGVLHPLELNMLERLFPRLGITRQKNTEIHLRTLDEIEAKMEKE